MKNTINSFRGLCFFVLLASTVFFTGNLKAQYTVTWTNAVNASVTGSGTILTKTGGFGYDGRGISENELLSCVDGTIEFTATNVSSQSRYIGFTTNGGSTSGDIKHGFFITYGYLYFIKNGAAFPPLPTIPPYTPTGFPVSDGDRFKIERVGDQITLNALDCSTCFTSNPQTYSISTPSTTWNVAAAMLNDGDAVSNVAVSFAKPVSCNIDLWDRDNATSSLFNIYQNDNVGIGTLSPTNRLDVNGTLRVRDLTQDATLNNVVVVDNNGVLQYKADQWTRNAGSLLTYTTNTSDKFGIGTNSPTEKLDVDGSLRIRSIAQDNALVKTLVVDNDGVVKYRDNTNAFGGWYKQGTTSVPTVITDDIFTDGKVKIKQQLEVSSTLSMWGGSLNGGVYDRFVLYADDANGLLFEAPKDMSVIPTKLPIKFGWRGETYPGIIITGGSYMGVGLGATTPSYRMQLPVSNSNAGKGYAYSWIDASASKFKMNIKTLENSLDKVMKLRGVEYDVKPEFGGGHDVGLIAEEVDEVVPEVVAKDGDDYHGIAYQRLVALLIEATKEQQETITAQAEQIVQLMKDNEEIKTMLKQQGMAPSTQGSGALASLMNVRPNPTYGKTEVDYIIANSFANAKMVVYNELGQKVAEYAVEEQGKGTVSIDATSYAGGVYFCNLLVDGNLVEVQKFIVSK